VAASGRAVYQENCAPCHGLEGMGNGPAAADLPSPPTAFADPQAIWDLQPAELFHTTKFGRIEKLMPPWRNRLSDEQIWQVVSYAWSLHTNQRTVEAGAELYAAACASCHGGAGAGDGPEAAGEMPDFSNPAYAMTRSQAGWMAGWQREHPELGDEWTLDEQQLVLEAIRTFSYIPPWDPAFRSGTGVIQGQVRQGTAGGPDVPGMTVGLEAFANFELAAAFTTSVAADGSFEFRDLALDPSMVYFASVSASGVRYSSPILTLAPEHPTIATEIVVYEPTDDPTGITISRAHWIFDSQPGVLIVGQIYVFGSRADRTYMGTTLEGIDDPVTLAIEVPEDALEISLENGILGDRFQQVGNLIYDTTPLVPGEATKQIIVRYALPYVGTRATVGGEFLYPVDVLSLLVADLSGLQVSVSGLQNGGSQSFQGRMYQIWQGNNLQPGRLTMELDGLLEVGTVDPRMLGDGASSTATASGAAPLLLPWMPWTLGAVAVLALAAMVTWSWQRGQLRPKSQVDELRRQQSELIQQIAQLDDQHVLGELGEEPWRMQRAQLKARLLSVASRLSDSPTR
jgi:mono/diheme cytochrome c family protein